MLLVDTTVWIDFFRDRTSHKVSSLSDALELGKDVCICGPILTEVLQGIKVKKQVDTVDSLFSTLIYLPISRKSYLLAAEIYRRARADGVTIRKTIDCIISACAIEHKVPLLHSDKDYDLIKKYSKLKFIED